VRVVPRLFCGPIIPRPRPRFGPSVTSEAGPGRHRYPPALSLFRARTNSRRANADASQPPIHLSRATGALLASPGWCRVSERGLGAGALITPAFYGRQFTAPSPWLNPPVSFLRVGHASPVFRLAWLRTHVGWTFPLTLLQFLIMEFTRVSSLSLPF
jgi:hypothetical protein